MTIPLWSPQADSPRAIERSPSIATEASVRSDAVVKVLENQINALESDNFKVTEALADIQMMIDSRGWNEITVTDEDEGMTRRIAKDASKSLRELVVGNPFMKRASQLRIMYVWAAGVSFSCLDGDLPAPVKKAMKGVANKRYIFSADGQEELERAAFTDGNVYLLGNNKTKAFQRIPISEISGDLRNPDNPEEIWAYRRSWNTDPARGIQTQKVRWYHTDIYPEGKTKRFSVDGPGGTAEYFDRNSTMLDKSFNRQIGWAYGVADGLPSMAWAKLYKDFLVNGVITSKALANLVFKITAQTKKGVANAAVEVSKPGSVGNTLAMGAGNDISAMATAGKGYDFDSGRPIAAAIAAGVEVSLVALLSDPGAGGGSYGTAATLDAPARATGAMRRKAWDELFERIFAFMGLSAEKDLKVTWHDLPEDQVQRILQSWTLAHNSGLFQPEIIQGGMASALEVINPGKVPEGYMTPNNEKSIQRADVDTDGQDGDGDQGGGDGDATSKSASAGSGQGQSSPAGSLGNDHSTD